MTLVQSTVDRMTELKETAGRRLVEGVDLKKGESEPMPGAKFPTEIEIRNSKLAQAEMNRLKAIYEDFAQKLDVGVQQLSNRLKSRSKALGSDIANNAKFSDWINDRLDSSGPFGGRGKEIIKNTYKEGSASANIQKTERPPLGQSTFGKGQRGSVGFKPETPFQKFEKALPEPYKQYAKKMWEDLETKKSQRTNLANQQQLAAGEVIKNITGLDSSLVPITQPYKAVRDWIRGGEDSKGTKIGSQLVSGAKMYAQQTKNRAIRFAADVINSSKRAQETATYTKLFSDTGIISSWEKLSRPEQGRLWDYVKQYKMKEWRTPEQMRADGLSETQIEAYQTGKKHLEQTINEINAERVAHGEKEITPMPGYFPSRWKGNFYFEVRKLHADGRKELVRIETGDWKGIAGKGGLAGIRERFTKEHGLVYEVGEIQERPRYGDAKETYSLFDNLLDTIGRDHPDRPVLDSIFEQYTAEMADKTRNFRRHFDINSGVEGYRGDQLGKKSYENARDALYSLEGYMRDAHNYIETKRAAREVNQLLYDKELNMPKAKEYIREYWDASNGVESDYAKIFDKGPEELARALGFSRYTPKSLVHEMKRNMMIFFLGFNRPVFLLSQAIQPVQFMTPYLLRMKAELGAQGFDTMIASAQTKGYLDVTFALTKRNAYTQLGKEAFQYAKDNRIVDTHFLDEIYNSGNKTGHELTKLVTGQRALMATEKYARAGAYFQFVHFLEKSGLQGEQLFKTAADATDIAMTNYVRHERALIYRHFGIVGDMASPLTTFKHNYFSQLYLYGKEAIQHRNLAYAKPLLAFLLAQYMMGGYMGLPGRQELDFLIDTARAPTKIPFTDITLPALLDPRTKNVTQFLAAHTAKLQTGKDFIRYGLFSGMTGMDVSPTFAAASLIPEHGLSQMFPVVTKPIEIAGNMAKVAGKEAARFLPEGYGKGLGSTNVDRARLIKSMTPPAVKSIAEMINQNKQTGMIPNPNEHMAGDVRRGPPSMTDKNWVASGLGTNSIPESEQRTAAYQEKLQKEAMKVAKADIVGQVKDRIISGMPWSDLSVKYRELGGDFNELKDAVNRARFDENRTRLERAKGIPKNVNQAQQYKRIEEYGVSK